MTYYLISYEYTGPNPQQNVNADYFVIATEPACGNLDHQPRTSGWCGTSYDVSCTALGEYDTIEAARGAMGSDVREHDDWRADESGIDGAVERWDVGELPSMDRESSQSWAWECTRAITVDTTDEEIAATVAECEAECRSTGYVLDGGAVETMLEERRAALRDEAADA